MDPSLFHWNFQKTDKTLKKHQKWQKIAKKKNDEMPCPEINRSQLRRQVNLALEKQIQIYVLGSDNPNEFLHKT